MSAKLTVYVVVVSLADDLLQCAPDKAELATDGQTDGIHETLEENLHFWLNQVAASAPRAPIIVVATHLDKVTEPQRLAFVQHLEESFIDTAFERQILGGISCISSVTGEGIENLRERVEQAAMTLHGYGGSVPLSWLKFYDAATSLVREGTYRLSFRETQTLAGQCLVTLDNDELTIMLRLFTDLGLLLYQDEPNTRDLIVLKPQWLLDSMREILCVTSLQAKAQAAISRDAAPEWRTLLRYGRLDATRLLRYIFCDANSDEERHALLSLTQRFGLCCQLPVTQQLELTPVAGKTQLQQLHIVPSLLPQWEPSAIANVFLAKDNACAVLYLRGAHMGSVLEFDSNSFMPEAVFFLLIVELLGNLHPNEVRGACRHLYRDRVLVFGKQDYMLQRYSAEQLLKLVVVVETGTEAAAVAGTVQSCLNGTIASRFGISFEFSVRCEQCAALVAVNVTDAVSKCPQCRNKCTSPLCTSLSTNAADPLHHPGYDDLHCEVDEGLPLVAGRPAGGGTQRVEKEFARMLIPFSGLRFVKSLGVGGFGTVVKMLWQESTEVAVKTLHHEVLCNDERAEFEFLKEIEQLKTLHHPNIIQMLGVTRGNLKPGGDQGWMLVCEFMKSGSLFDWLHRSPRSLSWRWRSRVMCEVSKAMVYLHSELPSKEPIGHFDLKPANVLLSGDRVKIADFGLCRTGLHTTRAARSTESGREEPGTAEYMAPEIYDSNNTCLGTAADVYSFGIMLWEVMARQRPILGFPNAACRRQLPSAAFMILHWVAVDGLRPEIPDPPRCPAPWADLMCQCWQGEPRARLKFPQIAAALARILSASEAWKVVADDPRLIPSGPERAPEPEPAPAPAPAPAPEPEPEPEPEPAPAPAPASEKLEAELESQPKQKRHNPVKGKPALDMDRPVQPRGAMALLFRWWQQTLSGVGGVAVRALSRRDDGGCSWWWWPAGGGAGAVLALVLLALRSLWRRRAR
jgi:serine/threonine protein kinase